MGTFLEQTFSNDPWTPYLALLLDAGAKGFLLLALAGLAALAMRRSPAAARHMVWLLALTGLLLLPLVSLIAPRWQLAILPARPAPPVAAAEMKRPTPSPAPAPIRATQQPRDTTRANSPALPVTLPPAQLAPPPDSTRAGPATPRMPIPLAPAALLTWGVVALAILLPLLIGHAAIARVRRRARDFPDGGIAALADSVMHALGLPRSIAVRRAGHGAMPMAAGLLRPAVFLPSEAEQWPEDKQRAVLLHELAHIKRRDCLTHALARVAVSLHWFNPLAWIALRQLRIEREHACDDLVLTAGELPSAYAEHLLEIARSLRAGTLTAAAAITLAKKSHLEGRLLAVLDAARNRGLLTRKFLLTAILAAAASLVVLGGATVAREISSTDDLLAVAKPVKETSLEGFFGGWRNLPFHLSDGAAADTQACLTLAREHNSIRSGVNQFTLPEIREKLEAILAGRPDFFYAEYLLGTWHQMKGDAAQAAEYFLRSYRHAPVVIVQRYEGAEKRPLAGVSIQRYQLECNRVQGGSLDPSLVLEFFELTTDGEGCIYLPVYDTVYRATAKSNPEGFDVNYPSLGWFKSRGKVGMMPVAGVGIVGGAYEKAVASDTTGAVRVSGRGFQVTSVRRMDAPEALEVLEFPVWPREFPHRDRFPELAEGEWDCLLLDIGGKGQFPKDFDVVGIRVFDHETRQIIWDSDWHYYNKDQGNGFVGGFCSALNNAVFLARRDGKWPDQIDLWFRIDLLKDSPSAHHYLPVGLPDAAISTGSGDSIKIEEIRAGSWNRSYAEEGGAVTWIALNPDTEETACSIALRRTGNWGGGRMNVCAVDQRGNRHWPDSIHFVDFERAALQVVNFPVAADQLLALEFGQVEHPSDFRRSFYFDGVELPDLNEETSGPRSPRARQHPDLQLPDYLRGTWQARAQTMAIGNVDGEIHLELHFDAENAIAGTLGKAKLSGAYLSVPDPGDWLMNHGRFNHRLEGHLSGKLGGRQYSGPVVFGLRNEGNHWSAQPFVSNEALGGSGGRMAGLPSFEMLSLVAPYARTYPGGVQATVVAIGQSSSGSGPTFWAPDGSPLPAIPHGFPMPLSIAEPGRGEIVRHFYVRVETPVESAPEDRPHLLCQVDPDAQTNVEISFEERSGFVTVTTSIPIDRIEAALRLAVADGPWEPLVACGFASGSTVSRSESTFTLNVGGPYEWNGKRVADVSHNISGKDGRLVAIDTSDQVRMQTPIAPASEGELMQMRFPLGDLTQDNLKRFELQAREYEWREIAGIPLYPNAATDKTKAPQDVSESNATENFPKARFVIYIGARGSGSNCATLYRDLRSEQEITMSCGYPGAVSDVTGTYLGHEGDGWRFAFTRRFPSDGPNPETTNTEVVYTGGTLAVFEDEYQWIGFESQDQAPTAKADTRNMDAGSSAWGEAVDGVRTQFDAEQWSEWPENLKNMLAACSVLVENDRSAMPGFPNKLQGFVLEVDGAEYQFANNPDDPYQAPGGWNPNDVGEAFLYQFFLERQGGEILARRFVSSGAFMARESYHLVSIESHDTTRSPGRHLTLEPGPHSLRLGVPIITAWVGFPAFASNEDGTPRRAWSAPVALNVTGDSSDDLTTGINVVEGEAAIRGNSPDTDTTEATDLDPAAMLARLRDEGIENVTRYHSMNEAWMLQEVALTCRPDADGKLRLKGMPRAPRLLAFPDADSPGAAMRRLRESPELLRECNVWETILPFNELALFAALNEKGETWFLLFDTDDTKCRNVYLWRSKEDQEALDAKAWVDELLIPQNQLAWGEINNGLQAAVLFKSPKEAYPLNEAIPMAFVLRNAGKAPIELVTSEWRDDFQAVVTNADNKELGSGISSKTGINPLRRINLKPGEVSEIRSAPFAFLAEGADSSLDYQVADVSISTIPGRHTVQFEIHFPDAAAQSGKGEPQPGDWEGTLTTGKVVLNVVAAGAVAGPAREEEFAAPPENSEASEFEKQFPGDPIKRFFAGSRARSERLMREGIKIDFVQRVQNVVDDPEHVDEYTGTMWMLGGNEVVEMRNTKGNTSRHYQLNGVHVTDGLAYFQTQSRVPLIPNYGLDVGAAPRSIGYPVPGFIPGFYLSKQWRSPGEDNERWLYDALEKGAVIAENVVSTGSANGIPFLTLSTNTLDAVAPQQGFAWLGNDDVTASDLFPIGDGLWFPRKVVNAPEINPPVGFPFDGPIGKYHEEIEVTDAILAPVFPEGLFTLPEPEDGDLVYVAYAPWDPQWDQDQKADDTPVPARWCVNASTSFTWGPTMSDEDREILEVSEFWRQPGKAIAALAADEPLPFFDRQAKRIVWARYDGERKRHVRRKDDVTGEGLNSTETSTEASTTDSSVASRIAELLAGLGRIEGGIEFHMTLQTADTDETRELVEIGKPAVPQLIAALADPNKHIRRHAAYVLGKIGDPNAVEPLLACCRAEHAHNAEASEFDNDVLEPATMAVVKLLFPEHAEDHNWVFPRAGTVSILIGGGYRFEWQREPELEAFWQHYREVHPTIYTKLEIIDEEIRAAITKKSWDSLSTERRTYLDTQKTQSPEQAPYIPIGIVASTLPNFQNRYEDAQAWWAVADNFLAPGEVAIYQERLESLYDDIAQRDAEIVPQLLPPAHPRPEEYRRFDYVREILGRIGKDALPALLAAWEHPERHAQNILISYIAVVDLAKAHKLEAGNPELNPTLTRFNHLVPEQAPLPPENEIAWGVTEKELQAAFRFLPEKDEYKLGEPVRVEYFVRNTGKHPVAFVSTVWREHDACIALDAQGRPMKEGTVSPTGLRTGAEPSRRFEVAPGAMTRIQGAGFAFVPEGMAFESEIDDRVRSCVETNAGTLSVRFELQMPDIRVTAGDTAPQSEDWTGTLTTGKVAVKVAGSDTQSDAVLHPTPSGEKTVDSPAAPVSNTTPTPISDVTSENGSEGDRPYLRTPPANIPWGPINKGLQAAVYF